MILLLALRALAILPLPTYPDCGEQDRPDLCPSDLGTSWSFISWIPEGSRATVRPEELEIGSGNGIDRAWRTTTGRFDVMLAICDSGFDWGDGDFVNKVALNLDELPTPQRADGSEVDGGDLDGNGLVNVQDWAEDPRVDVNAGDSRGDGLLDPSDLLAAFSDGVDDDLNGYTDDIAGWDFYADDNDPFHTYDDDFGTHGAGVAEEMAAEGGNGGDIGVCPNCSILPVRVGDTFVTDGSRAGMGIAYAASRGAVAINLSVGALTGPELARDATEYAHALGVSLVGAAGDENAYHHNQPAMYEHFLYVHSIHPDSTDEDNGVFSYLNFFNCNNYGPRLTLSVDSPACATGAAAQTTGVVGLVHSAARDAGLTLTADEVYQLVVGAVDDIHLSDADIETANTYPSGPGWDFFYGYGRLNAFRAVEAVKAGAIPPTADLTSPAWFDTFTPDGKLPIQGRLAADRSSGFDWTIEYGMGADPQTWTPFGSGSSATPVEGTLAELDLASLPVGDIPEADVDEDILQRVDRVFSDAVTVRVRVTDAEGRTGTFRKTFFVRPDADLVDGWPIDMGESGESSPILTDLDGDRIFEVVVATGGGRVHAYRDDGTELPGWPVTTQVAPRWHEGQATGLAPLPDGFVGTVAVGDIDGDGSPEVVGASGGGFVYVWHADGTPASGFPVEMVGRTPDEFDSTHTYDNGFAAAPTLYDLDDDGTLELLAVGMDQRLYVWDYSGAPWGPYPVDVCDPENCDNSGTRAITSPTVGDVDGDGDVDIGVGTNETVHDGQESVSFLYDADTATLLQGWPLRESGLIDHAGLLPIVGEGHPASMAFADIDGDGQLEISSPIMLGQSPLYRWDGTVYKELAYVRSEWPEGAGTNEPSFATMTTNPSFGDMNGDGTPEFLISGAGTYYLLALPGMKRFDFQHVAAAWDGKSGTMLAGWPRQLEDLQFLIAPAVADVSGDGKPEAVFASAGYLLYAWDEAGKLAPGWPKFTGNWVLGSPAVGDLDGDGLLEVVVSTREGHLYAWHTQGAADQDVQWASVHHDPQNTGNYGTPLEKQLGPPRTEECGEDACCCGTRRGASNLLAFLPLLVLWRRARR